MPAAPLTGLVGHVRRLSQDVGLTDAQLLDAYLTRRDEAAFECLVWRHGPAVLGACRRILQNESDAEDAFQATFLVLIRKGNSLRPHDPIGAWLYGVACNVAKKSRADTERRRAKDLSLSQRPQPEPIDLDLRPAIDFELNRLPEKYRAAVVLCELEEQPIADAAVQLGWPQGTVASRLARGRELLGKRLIRHGIGLSTLVGVSLSGESVAGVMRAVRESGGVSHRLADTLVRSMFVAKLKTAAVATLCVAIFLIAGVTWRMAASEKGDPPKQPDPPKKAPEKSDPPKPANPLVGRWKIIKQTYNGESNEPPGIRRVWISDQIIHFTGIGLLSPLYSWKVDSNASPATLDLTEESVDSRQPDKVSAIYKLDGDKLAIAMHHVPMYGVPGNNKLAGRPKDFDAKDTLVLNFERDNAKHADYEDIVGRWRVRGDRPYKVIEFRQQPHQGLMIAENAKHEADWFSWVLDERKEPRQIDVYARVEGASNPNHGIYRFKGDRLQIYLGAELKYQGDPGRHTRPTSLDVEGKTGRGYLELERENVAWGKALENGLQFGVGAEPNGRAKVEIGDTVEFRLFVRNTTNKAIDVDLPKMDGVPLGWTVSVRDGSGKDYKVSEPPPPPGVPVPPSRLKLKMVDYQVADIGTFKLRFVARDDKRAADFPPATTAVSPGDYSIHFTANKMWGAQGTTGEVKLKVESAIAWGPPVDGLQFGLRQDKSEYTIGDTVKLAVHARNASDKEITFLLLDWWLSNGTPIIKDTDGKDVKPSLAQPPVIIGPQPVTKLTLKTGETIELAVANWSFVELALPGMYKVDHVVLEKPGTYTFQYPDLHAKVKPAWPTGAVKLTFKKAPQVKADAERLLGSWSIVSSKRNGGADSEGKYRFFEFRAPSNRALFVAHGDSGLEHWFTWKIDATKTPKEIDLSARVPGFANPHLGVYEFDGEKLRIGLGTLLQYTGDPGKHTRPTSVATAAYVLELAPTAIAWGQEKDGLQFGLSLGAGQRKEVHLGDSIRFQLHVRNNTDGIKEYEARKLDLLPAYAGVRASRSGKSLKTVTALPPGGLPKPDKVAVPARSIQVVGEFAMPFVPIEDRNFGAHVVGEMGVWDVEVPDFNNWMPVAGHATGRIEVELLPWDKPHVDGRGVAWGQAVGNLQYGLVHAKPTQTDFKHFEKMTVRLWARYVAAGSLEISLPSPDELWQVGRPPIVSNPKGKVVEFGMPAPIPREPPGLRKCTLRSGTPVEIGTATWPIVDERATKSREFGVPTILADPGMYSIHFPSVGGARKADEVPVGTGKLAFWVK